MENKKWKYTCDNKLYKDIRENGFIWIYDDGSYTVLDGEKNERL